SSSPVVRLYLNGRGLPAPDNSYQYLYTFKDVAFEPGKLEAVGYSADGLEESRYVLETAGETAALRLTAMENPLGFTADGADVALLEFEIVDADGRRCPLDNRMVQFTVDGPAEWRGGIAQGPDNYILSKSIPVECGVNRALIRATDIPGTITVTANAEGLPGQTLTLVTRPSDVAGGLSDYRPSRMLKGRLTRGATPSTPSYKDEYFTVDIAGAVAASNNQDAALSYDDNELSKWDNDGTLENARIDYTLARPAAVSRIDMKLGKWRTKKYPIEVWADNQLIWKGQTDTSLGYVHLYIDNPVVASTYSVRLAGAVGDSDKFARIVELAGGPANELEVADKKSKGKQQLTIVEIDFLEKNTAK
ncbi:MAG: beta-galactosidase, partial [Duncaniella sp.]|nr:beta-galactosidase [Duncaniella sp.]